MTRRGFDSKISSSTKRVRSVVFEALNSPRTRDDDGENGRLLSVAREKSAPIGGDDDDSAVTLSNIELARKRNERGCRLSEIESPANLEPLAASYTRSFHAELLRESVLDSSRSDPESRDL